MSTVQQSGKLKNLMMLKDSKGSGESGAKAFKKYMTEKTLVIRLYILKGKSLTPKDTNTSDPYLQITLGGKVIKDMDSLRMKTNNPGFYTSYDISATLPGPAVLKIEAWDYDGFKWPDLIGYTKIDIEDRYFHKDWLKTYPNKKPIEERTLFSDKSSAP
jgi:hypothetical protein